MKISINKQYGRWFTIGQAFIAVLLLTVSSLGQASSCRCADDWQVKVDCSVRNYADGCEWDNAKCMYYGLPIRPAVSSTQ